ncbi:DUF4175 domain-containing protein [Luteimonas suaedae]|uniref:DUF4175 domain-containing protein n=1 Tax=Luteimonas suaedae TaxID=2605430 RepID=UPI0011F07E63|nr:DUF4175 domain-containing protein [Luteimonas suaedae]
MNADSRLRQSLHAARRRVLADAALCAAPLVVLATAVAWRSGGHVAAIAAGLLAIALAAAAVVWRARRLDSRWQQRRLNQRRRDLDDSADLLFADDAALGTLQRLQRARLRQRLADAPTPDLRPAWSRRRNALAWLLALPLALAVLLWPARDTGQGVASRADAPGTTVAGTPRLVAQTLRIAPPAYTGLPARNVDGLEAKAPEGSRLRWTLRIAPQPASAELVFHDGERLALERDGDAWIAARVLDRSTLYRVLPAGAAARPPPPLQRLDAIADRPPRVRVLAPERSLTQMAAGQRSWSLAFEADDDYGVAAVAQLRITLARGSGENITFDERTRTLRGRGEATRRRFEANLDLAELALAPGEDLVVQLQVQDNRAPRPQSARSPSLILRRPADPVVDTVGLEGLARKVLPAYFRSQRQIIIDAEALQKEKPQLQEARFLERSDTIGVDQRLLRLRYGQFLGEESEGAPRPLPTADADDHDHEDGHDAEPATTLPIDDYWQAPSTAREHDEHAHEDDHGDELAADVDPAHAHDHGTAEDSMTFGREADVLEEFGHTHDIPEAATLLDPQTRETLRSALGEMWQSELNLRQGRPDRALPYAYRALELIKQVQQADRIYLARVGPELPPIDESRRLGGDRDGIGRRALPAAAGDDDDDDGTPARIWRALGGMPLDEDAPVDLDALEAWLRGNAGRVQDPLAYVAAIDALRNDPDCNECRDALRALLWTALARPPAAVPRRAAADAAGRRYLDTLREPSP